MVRVNGFENWGDAVYGIPWPCACENLFSIKYYDRVRVLRGLEVKKRIREC